MTQLKIYREYHRGEWVNLIKEEDLSLWALEQTQKLEHAVLVFQQIENEATKQAKDMNQLTGVAIISNQLDKIKEVVGALKKIQGE